MKLLIGLTGHPLAGKGTVSDRLAERLTKDGVRVARLRFSDVLRETLDLWGMPHGRDNEQKLAQAMEFMGEGTLSRAAKRRILADPVEVGILDGVRWLSDEEMIRGLVLEGVKSFIVYIAADADIRFARLIKRGRAGEETTTRAKFDEQGRQKNEIFIEAIGSRADAKIENNSHSLEDLIAAVDAVYDQKIKPAL